MNRAQFTGGRSTSPADYRPRTLTSRYIVKRRPRQSSHHQPDQNSKLFESIAVALKRSSVGGQHQRLLSTFAVEDNFERGRLPHQHQILHISGRNKMKPLLQPPETADISNRLREYQQLLVKIKETRGKVPIRERPMTPPPDVLGVDCYYSNLVQSSGLPNNTVRSIAVRK